MTDTKATGEQIEEDRLIDEARGVLDRLKRRLEEHSLWMRKSSGVDLIIGGHLRRATMALESTMLLAEAGAAYDSAVTARVVLDHALSAASIALADDPEQEAYYFITRQWRHIRDTDKKLREHYPSLNPPDEATSARIQQLIEQTEGSWAGERLGSIVKRLDAKDASGTRIFSWFFDVPYSALSNYVHARAIGLRSTVPILGEPFHFDVAPDPRFAINAVRQGMIGYLAMMIAVQQAWGTDDLRKILLDPLEDFVRRAGPAGEMGVLEL